MITGSRQPSVFHNMVVTECLRYAKEHEFGKAEASADAEDAWVEHANQLAGYTLFPTANSWYVGANVPGKPRVFMPYIGRVARTGKVRRGRV